MTTKVAKKRVARVKRDDAPFPYGRCQCGPEYGCMACGGTGPAAYEATRDGKRLRLCTRCDLTSDTDKVLLIQETDTNVQVFKDFDALGFFCIIRELMERRKQKDAE